MWSDRLTPARRESLVKRLRAVLPAPRKHARGQCISLSCGEQPSEVAAALWPRRDFVWLDQPAPRIAASAVARLTVRQGRATVRGPRGTIHVAARGFDLLEAAMEAWGNPPEALLCGSLGYELGCEIEEVEAPAARKGDPSDLDLGLYDWWLERSSEGWCLHGTDAWRRVPPRELRLSSPAARFSPLGPYDAEVITSAPSGPGYREAVARTVERIYNGELFQVNLCRRLETGLPARQILPLFERMRAISPASHGALLRTGTRSAVLSLSPELFLSARGGAVRSCPIKGTRPRGRTPEEDRTLALELETSEKDRAELAMIVDVTRNDLGRVCAAGSVKVVRHAELMSLPTVHHTYSEVAGTLRPESGPADLLRACFPPASITGAPKIRAMQLAALEEGFRRGAAMGSIGWISMGGDLELSVAIRTAVASRGKVWYLAGCGITAESVPAEELAESEAKAVAFRKGLAALPVTAAVRESVRY